MPANAAAAADDDASPALQYPAIDDYRMANRTYRYASETATLYPFGFGLSYVDVPNG